MIFFVSRVCRDVVKGCRPNNEADIDRRRHDSSATCATAPAAVTASTFYLYSSLIISLFLCFCIVCKE